ncbi:MAG TPA: tetratricopeptide repeat protein, partial [Anaerolineales bacterium]
MPYDRRPSANSGRPKRPGRPTRAGQSGDRRASGDAKRIGRPRRDPRATPVDDGAERPRRGGRVAPRRVEKPKTAAQQRAAEVKAARGERPPRQAAAPPPWEREQWVDEGPMRTAARKATARARRADAPQESPQPSGRRTSRELAPQVAEELQLAAPATRVARYQERLASAADALDRGRYDDARRMVQPVLRDLPDMAFGHEIAGLALYRTGQWRKAAAELERARQLDRTLDHHAVLADCYRALKRYDVVEQLWLELREGSPAPELMAEGRIVAAGALADQGDLKGALKIMERAADVPKKVREHHLRQWYVL